MTKCLVCGKRVRPGTGIFLFLLTNGKEVWTCGRVCTDQYNEDQTGAYDVKGSVGEARGYRIHSEQQPAGEADTVG